MKFDKTLIIPDLKRLDESLEIAEKYSLGFEYDDFYSPKALDDKEFTDNAIKKYKSCKLPEFCTCHGDFYDVLIFSDDALIRKISGDRIYQSLEIAERIGASGIVFHTNHNPDLKMPAYVKNWLNTNVEFWEKALDKYKNLNIFIENMFDNEPSMLASLAAELRHFDNFGVCFDYAHAAISETPLDSWVSALSPYVRHVHINDNDLRSDLHLAVGDGKIDWKKFCIHYETYMPDASVLIETSSIENQLRSLRFLEKKCDVAFDKK